MTLDEQNRISLIKYRTEQANLAIEDVDFLIKNNKYHLAVNRIYYGIFYIISALALKKQFNTSKHEQLIGWFNKNFVKTGICNPDISSIVHKAYNKRTKIDYSFQVKINEEEINEMFIQMKLFIDAINHLLYAK